jgi:hypothetical protein
MAGETVIDALIIAAVLVVCSIGLIRSPAASSNVAQAGFIGLFLSIVIILIGAFCA